MAEIGSGSGAATDTKNTTTDSPASSLSPASSALLEGVLVVAIIAETGAMAYFYRERLADFFQKVTSTSGVEQVSTQVVDPTFEIQGVTPSAAIASTLPSATLAANATETAIASTGTPIPSLLNANTISSTAAAAIQTNSASALNGGNGNNGNHYGQTPQPVRTKENNGNNNNNGNQNGGNNKDPNDKPPKKK